MFECFDDLAKSRCAISLVRAQQHTASLSKRNLILFQHSFCSTWLSPEYVVHQKGPSLSVSFRR